MSLFKTTWIGCMLLTIVYPSRKPKKLTNNVKGNRICGVRTCNDVLDYVYG